MLLWLTFACSALGQPVKQNQSLSILFYNVENLFDTENDPSVDDEEFCSGGLRNWNYFRLKDKLNKVSKVILASAGFDTPAIIGLCEVENRDVLELLVSETPLKSLGYRLIHKDSPDERGIDVALLYRPDKVEPLFYQYHPVANKNGTVLTTREILQCDFKIIRDTLTVFINHWPSRYGGQAETEADRMLAAANLKAAVDECCRMREKAKLVIMGDFNDQPTDVSIKKVLQVVAVDDPAQEAELINLSEVWSPKGTLKHQQSWQIFDQIIVSDYLLCNTSCFCSANDARPVELPFLFESDEHWGGKRLFRTYRGYTYAGGFSDHLPVLLKLHLSN